MIEDALKNLGLNETQMNLYRLVLSLKEVPASILAKRLKIPRSTSKYSCEQLVQRGLLSRFQKNQTWFYTPYSPDSLHLLIDDEQRKLDRKRELLDAVLPELKALYLGDGSIKSLRFFEGEDAVIRMFMDVLDSEEEIYGVIHYPDELPEKLAEFIRNVYVPRRKHSKQASWILFNDTPQAMKYREQDYGMNRISLLVPTEHFPFDICMHIYGQKLAFYSYRLGSVSGVIIEDPSVLQLQRSMFKMAWNLARTLPKNANLSQVDLSY